MAPEMKNPYREPVPDSEVRCGAVGIRLVVILFVAIIALPPLVGGWGEPIGAGSTAPGGTLVETLRNWEKRFEDLPVFEAWRQRDQARLVSWFGEGNNRVVIGREGWLFYRPDIETVVGKGPRYVEPPSVARAPTERPWNRPLPVIADFAGQLEERGIDLVVVPIPTKAMIEASRLGVDVEGAPIAPPEWDPVLAELERSGAAVFDLLPHLANRVESGPVFLRQDTHWTPETMESVAAWLAERLEDDEADTRERRPDGGRLALVPEERSHRGDLVEMLELSGDGPEGFEQEQVAVARVKGSDGELAPRSDPESDRVLLGDSFVNVFEDPALGFSAPGEERIGAGFASHLARELGRTLHVIAINGGGASGVRKALASLPGAELASKRQVVWVFSARDLFLAEVPGRRARVEWDYVTLPPVEAAAASVADSTTSVAEEPGGTAVVVEAIVRERSVIEDPADTPYHSALYSVLLEDLEVVSGEFAGDEAWVFLWAFRDRELLDTASLRKGDRYRFDLVPLPMTGAEASATQLDDFLRFDLERWFAKEAVPVPE